MVLNFRRNIEGLFRIVVALIKMQQWKDYQKTADIVELPFALDRHNITASKQ